MSETCAAAVPLTNGGWRECGRPAVSTFTYACEHEHVAVRSTCAEHEPAPGEVGCRPCWDAGHECELVFTAVPDGV